ncbi:hypothetical protein L1987_06414 [Smallanthus sonchifolius]|uniref:Uncharacterized protein n=1 Tax=Smallanthus sonchifolius TaxID=185202 RepID=A0ACB9JY15_9ASTR|nr:hypothetical protein L1987_06414 [Smallanthus sonchifolius]
MMARKGKEPVRSPTPEVTPERPTSPFPTTFNEDLINMTTQATSEVISQLKTQVDNLKAKEKIQDKEISFLKTNVAKQQESIDKMMKLIENLQAQVTCQTYEIDLTTCFDFEGFGNKSNLGKENVQGENVEGEKDKEDNEEEKEEDKEEGDAYDNQDKTDKDNYENEDQGDVNSRSSDSSDSFGNDDEGLNDSHTSADKGTKLVYTTNDGKVMDNITDVEDTDEQVELSISI